MKLVLEKGLISQKMDKRETYENKLRIFLRKGENTNGKTSSSSLLIKRQSKEGIVSVYNKIFKKNPRALYS